MEKKNYKNADRLIRLIWNRLWSEGDSHKYDLDQYGVSNAELPIVLSKVTDRGLNYKLSKSSSGKSTLKVYAPSTSSTSEMVRSVAACFLLLISIFPISLIFMLLMVFVYPLFTIATKLTDDRWISLEDFCNSYWEFLSVGDY